MEFVILWVVLSVMAGMYASSKGLSGFAHFFGSLLFSPLLGFLSAAIASPNKKVIETRLISGGENKKCPHCAEIIKAEARVCRFCGREVAAAVAPTTSAKPTDAELRAALREKLAKLRDSSPSKGERIGP